MFDLSLFGWLGLGGGVVAAALAVAWFIPPLRRTALLVAAAAFAGAAAYAKGNRDRADLEQRRKDEAVRKVQKDYAEIDARPDDVKSAADRLRHGSF
jgi:hypothetical protein